MKRKYWIIFSFLGALVLFLLFSYWYMIMCEGSWNGRTLDSGLKDELKDIKNNLVSDVSYLSESLGPRNPTHFENLVAAEEWISKYWESQGYEVNRQTFWAEGKEYANLEIEIPGHSLPSEIVIVSAQYDTHPDSPGANNNAGGIAVLLRLGELLKSQQLDRTVRLVAFTTQEPPYSLTEFMGSRVYAKSCYEKGDDIRMILCMDAIGVYKHEAGTQRLPFPFSLFYPDKGDFLAFISDLDSRSCLVDVTRGFKKGTSFHIEAGCAPRWVKGVTWSDHESFWRYGYKGIQITDTGAFRSSAHVTRDDTMEKMDLNALAQITIGMYASILEVANLKGTT